MKKYDKMVLREIAKEYEVKQSKVTFLESFSLDGKMTKVTFRIYYNRFENIVYECEPYILGESVTLYQNRRIGTWEEYMNL